MLASLPSAQKMVDVANIFIENVHRNSVNSKVHKDILGGVCLFGVWGFVFYLLFNHDMWWVMTLKTLKTFNYNIWNYIELIVHIFIKNYIMCI